MVISHLIVQNYMNDHTVPQLWLLGQPLPSAFYATSARTELALKENVWHCTFDIGCAEICSLVAVISEPFKVAL